MAKQLDNFEKSINESLTQFEVHFDAGHWNEMNSMLDAKKSTKNYHIEKWAVSGGLLSVIAAIIFVLSPMDETKSNLNYSPIVKCQKNRTVSLEKQVIPKNVSQEKDEIVAEIIEQEIPVKIKIESVGNLETEIESTKNSGSSNTTIKEFDRKELIRPSLDVKSEKEEIEIRCEKAIYCTNEKVMFSTNANKTVYWEFGDATGSSDKNAVHKYEQSGEFLVKLYVDEVLMQTKKIKINPSPELYFDIREPSEFDVDQEYELNASNYGTIATTWLLNGNVIIQNSNEALVSIYKRGNHEFELLGENEYKCQSRIKKEIIIDKDYDLLAPKSFSPNGDGKNEYWIPNSLKEENIEFELTIFNRAGKLVYKTNSADNPWNGSCVDNTKAKAMETYIWNAIYTNRKGERNVANGAITIVD